jgi:AraC-like DNA-binding protein
MTEVGPRVPGGLVTMVEESALFIVEPVMKESADYDAFIERMKAVMRSVSERYQGDATAAVSARESLDTDLAALYNHLRVGVAGAFYQSGELLVRPGASHSDASFADLSSARDPAAVAEQLVSSTHAAALSELEQELSEAHVHPDRVQEFARRVVDQLQVLAGSGGPQLPRISGVRRLSRMIERLATAAELVRTAREEHGEISARGDINRVARYVREHIAEPISAESMADLAGMSLAHFSRVFKKASGLTFSEYLTLTRIDVAKHRLRTTGDTIDEIARVSGFENVAYFHRVFKRKTGVTPGDFRGMSHTLGK